jgi:AcrR family transcriptional regulator
MKTTSGTMAPRGAQGESDPLELDLTRHRILKGASEVFAKRGGRDPTVDELVKAGGVARRTFYRAFRNSDEVLLALYEIACAKVIERVHRAIAEHDDAWGKLEAGLWSFLDFHTEAGQLLRVLQAEAMRPSSPLERRREDQLDTIAAIFDREIQLSQGRRIDPLVLRGLLLAIEGLSNVFLMRASAGGEIDKKRARKVMLRIIGATLAPDGVPGPPMPLAP